MAQPQPIYEQLKPARIFPGKEVMKSAPAAAVAVRNIPRRDLGSANARMAASNR